MGIADYIYITIVSVFVCGGLVYLFKPKKKAAGLNATILRRYRTEAYGHLIFIGSWSGYWKTTIDGIVYRSDRVSGFKYIKGDYGDFVTNAILDRVRLVRNKTEEIKALQLQNYGRERWIDSNGNADVEIPVV
jgi:hypothetical protein